VEINADLRITLREVSAVIEDPTRLAILEEVMCVVAQSMNTSFDRVCKLASMLLNAPVSLISFVAKDHQVYVGQHGLEDRTQNVTPLSHSFCQYVVATGNPLMVTDARNSFLKTNPAITDSQVVSYLGVPIVTWEGARLGSLCVFDRQPREWQNEEFNTLTEFSYSVNELVQSRMALRAQQELSNEMVLALQDVRQALLAEQWNLPEPEVDAETEDAPQSVSGRSRRALTTNSLLDHLARFEKPPTGEAPN
jgi:GAF domain-containing protein